jgi:hypothetical protein
MEKDFWLKFLGWAIGAFLVLYFEMYIDLREMEVQKGPGYIAWTKKVGPAQYQVVEGKMELIVPRQRGLSFGIVTPLGAMPR